MAEQRTLDAERAELYPKAVAIVKEHKRASVSLVQRRLRLSWDTARDLVELMLERKDVPVEWAPVVYQLVARRAPPALDAEGLPELPKPVRMSADQAYLGYTAEQVRQAQRDAVAADRRSRVSADQWASLDAARVQLEAAKVERENRVARQSAPEGAPVACEHNGKRTTHWDYIRCSDCGAVKTDSGWGIAKNQWFKDKDEAEFYKKTGARPAAPTSASAQPPEGVEHASDKEKSDE